MLYRRSKTVDEVHPSADRDQRVRDLVTLEQVLENLDGADGVDVEVGEQHNPLMTEQVEELLANILDVHPGAHHCPRICL